MPLFQAQAIDSAGRELREQLEAATEEEAMLTLQKKNLMVLEIRNLGDVKARPSSTAVAKGVRVPTAIAMQFYEQLGFLVKAGIPIYLAIKMLSEQMKSPALSEVLKGVLFDLSEGLPLSVSLQKHPESFPALHTNLIGVGEKSGNLDAALGQLVDLVRENQAIRAMLVKATAYPLFLLGLSLALVFGLLLFVFPKFQDIFQAFEVKLPPLTQFLINASETLRGNIAAISSVTFILVWALIYFFRSDSTSESRDKLFLAIPVVREVFISMFVALFFKTLSSLLRSGIPLLEGLGICQETIRGQYKQKFFSTIIGIVREGEPTSKAMENQDLIPELARQLVMVGEKTGNIDQMLENGFQFYKKRYIDMLGKTTAILQPILMFFAAGLICVVAIALFVPLFKLSSSMRSGGG